jgi:hypothetical protein
MRMLDVRVKTFILVLFSYFRFLCEAWE